MLIAVTGGMGSGKSLLGQILKGCADVYDADVITRRLQAPGGTAYDALRGAFGAEFFTPELDRARLARAVFSDRKLLERLNGIVHPLVRAEIGKIGAAAGDKPVFVLVPLLFESGLMELFDAVWLITAAETARKARVLARDPLITAGDLDARLAAQLSEAGRLEAYKKSFRRVRNPEWNRIIGNDGTSGEFKEKVLAEFYSIATPPEA